MISHYLLEISLNHVTLCIFEQGMSSRFRKYYVKIEYAVTNNETEVFFTLLPFVEKQGGCMKFLFKEAKLQLAFRLVF